MLGEHAGRLLDSANLLLDQIMLLPAAQGWSWDAIGADAADHAELKRLTDRYAYVEALWLTDQDGWPRVTSRQFPAPRVNSGDREYFITLRDRRTGPLLSRLLTSRVTGRSNIVLARRLEDTDGAFRGMAQAVLPPAYFLDFYRSLALPRGTEVTLFRDDRAVVVRYPAVPDELAVKLDKWTAPPFGWGEAESGTDRAVSAADGVERVESWRRVGRFPVHIAVGHAVPEIEAEWRRLMLAQGSLVAGGLVAVGLVTLLAWRLAKREERTLAGLEDRVRQRTEDLAAALAARELLLKEVHHRVKNNLQLVSSLLGIQSRRATDDETRRSLRDASARVTAIAELHRNLYRGDRPNEVELASYLRQLCDDLSSAGLRPTEDIDLSTEPVNLPVDTVVPLALIVSELFTNALKHAHVDGRPARIAVVQRRLPQGGAVIEVADDGPGKAADAMPGFGTSLIQALARQINAELRECSDQRGTRVTIEVPHPSGVEVRTGGPA
jgi:two-component sensor histidine kinase